MIRTPVRMMMIQKNRFRVKKPAFSLIYCFQAFPHKCCKVKPGRRNLQLMVSLIGVGIYTRWQDKDKGRGRGTRDEDSKTKTSWVLAWGLGIASHKAVALQKILDWCFVALGKNRSTLPTQNSNQLICPCPLSLSSLRIGDPYMVYIP